MNRAFVFSVLLSFFVLEFGFSEETVHIIQKGETIYSIARSYGISAQEVLSLNGIGDARTIRAGQRIRIPRGGGAVSGDPGYGDYRVEKNDTLYGIARRHGVSLAELLELNGFSSSYVLKAGETIRIPVLQGQGAASFKAPGNGKIPPRPVEGKAAAGTSTGSGPLPDVRWPVSAKEVSYITGKLYGVQVTGERLEPVKSLTRGTVVSAGPYRGFGRVAIVQMAGGYLYVYGGCESLSVKEGDKVAPGTELGKLGVDAKSEKAQLFFFVYRSNSPIDPAAAPRA
ncbi:MAG: M23 family metallopeptidase [Treponema sp.]|jgi:murein DD-endopeptidase MepM/ murein hydrolase activator NlpD|nr:M23 family metallopeptidase [Treponema sp.]